MQKYFKSEILIFLWFFCQMKISLYQKSTAHFFYKCLLKKAKDRKDVVYRKFAEESAVQLAHISIYEEYVSSFDVCAICQTRQSETN